MHSQRGELATTLSILGIFISLVGITFGSISSFELNDKRASAQDIFTYKSILELREPDGDILKADKKITWHTKILATDTYPATEGSGQIQMPGTDRARLQYDATLPPGVPVAQQNREAVITVHMPEKWLVKDAYCTTLIEGGTGCEGFSADIERTEDLDYVIRGLKITNGSQIQYGLIAEKISASNPLPPQPQPTNPPDDQLCKAQGQACEDNYTEGCETAEGVPGTRECHKKGTCTGVGNGTQCSWGAGSSCGSCVSEGSGGGGSGGNPNPGPSCGKTCMYSVEERGQTKCYEGSCADGSQNCRLNTNCAYVSGCSTGKWVTCPGHSPTPIPLSGIPNRARLGTYGIIDFKCDGFNDGNVSDIKFLTEYRKSHSLPPVSFQISYKGQVVEKIDNITMTTLPGGNYPYATHNFYVPKILPGDSYTIELTKVPDGYDMCGTTKHIVTSQNHDPLDPYVSYGFNFKPEGWTEEGAPKKPTALPPRPSAGPKRQKKIMVVYYDTALPGRKTTVFAWAKPLFFSTPFEIVSEVIRVVNSSSNIYNYIIGEKITRSEFPPFENPTTVATAEKEFWDCFEGPKKCGALEKRKIDINKLFDEYQICEKVNRGEIDEVWNVLIPGYKIGENEMVGTHPFSLNSKPIINKKCKRNVPILTMSITASKSHALHSYIHRLEGVMAMMYGGERSWLRGNPWGDFNATKLNGSTAGCGNAHFTPVSTKDYAYDQVGSIPSYCDEHMSYPNIQTSKTKQVSCEDWGCNEWGYQSWMLARIPALPGRDSYGRLNNWWAYIQDVDLAAREGGRRISIFNSDLDNSSIVDTLDLSLMYDDLGKREDIDEGGLRSDVNADGVVNTYDMDLLINNIHEEIPQPTPLHPYGSM